MRYLISYDLDSPGKNYDALIGALESVGAKRVLFSQWVVRWDGTSAVGIRDWVKTFIDTNDRILVVEIDGTGWASYRAMTDINSI